MTWKTGADGHTIYSEPPEGGRQLRAVAMDVESAAFLVRCANEKLKQTEESNRARIPG